LQELECIDFAVASHSPEKVGGSTNVLRWFVMPHLAELMSGDRPPRPESPRPYYRCEETFERLNTWLRSKGITANKPLHELRKELGALIATEHGIYAASRFLRHSDISTTARHYADQKARISVGLGKYLTTNIQSFPQSTVSTGK
jgi:hypothetical protein